MCQGSLAIRTVFDSDDRPDADDTVGQEHFLRILEIIQSAPDLPTATNRLIEAANENGGPDNVTCILARWIE